MQVPSPDDEGRPEARGREPRRSAVAPRAIETDDAYGADIALAAWGDRPYFTSPQSALSHFEVIVPSMFIAWPAVAAVVVFTVP